MRRETTSRLINSPINFLVASGNNVLSARQRRVSFVSRCVVAPCSLLDATNPGTDIPRKSLLGFDGSRAPPAVPRSLGWFECGRRAQSIPARERDAGGRRTVKIVSNVDRRDPRSLATSFPYVQATWRIEAALFFMLLRREFFLLVSIRKLGD